MLFSNLHSLCVVTIRSRIPLRLLELNSSMMWQWPYIEEIVTLMQRLHFNGLIFHQEDIWSLLARPSANCRFALNSSEYGRIDAMLFLKRVIRYCKQCGIGVWLQGCATPTNGLLQKYPEYVLVDNQHADELFWQQYLSQVMEETFRELPDLRGIIVTLTAPDVDRASLSSLLSIFNRMTRAHGKRLVVREYLESKWQSWHVKNAINNLPSDVRISFKATRSGYRPGQPNNTAIAEFEGRQKWVEYDMWGIEFGWTLLPCYLLDEIQGRLCWASDVGGEYLEAICCKLSWERVSNSSLVNSINSINLQGLAMYSYEMGLEEKNIFHCWLNDIFKRQVSDDERKRMYRLMSLSSEWQRKTPYILGHLLQTHSQIPTTYEQALQLLFSEQHNMELRYTGQQLFSDPHPQQGLETLNLIQLEKERAQFLAREARSQAHLLCNSLTMPGWLRDLLLRVYERVPWYTEMFTHVGIGVAARYYMQRYERHPEVLRLLNQEIEKMRQLAGDLDDWLDEGRHRHPHYLGMLFDLQRLRNFADDLARSDD